MSFCIEACSPASIADFVGVLDGRQGPMRTAEDQAVAETLRDAMTADPDIAYVVYASREEQEVQSLGVLARKFSAAAYQATFAEHLTNIELAMQATNLVEVA